jgi:hypothetical protein
MSTIDKAGFPPRKGLYIDLMVAGLRNRLFIRSSHYRVCIQWGDAALLLLGRSHFKSPQQPVYSCGSTNGQVQLIGTTGL